MFALDILLDTIPAVLIDDTAHKRLRIAGDHLPDGLTGHIGLEARLHEDPQVDLALMVATERQLSVLAGLDPAIRLGTELSEQGAWQRAARLATRSLRQMRAASCLPPAVWLEFDLAADQGPLAPAVFIAAGPQPPSPDERPGSAGPTGTARRTDSIVAEILTTAAPPGAGADGMGRLVDVVRRVADSGFVARHLGLFPGRLESGMRLVWALASTVQGTTPGPGPLVQALVRAGWPGPRAECATWAETCLRWGDRVHLALDITPDGLGGGIGLEVFLAGVPQPREEPRWGCLLAELERTGLCTPAKRDALLRLGVEYSAELITRRVYRQGLHHLKIVIADSGEAVAKAYFGAYEAAAQVPGASGAPGGRSTDR